MKQRVSQHFMHSLLTMVFPFWEWPWGWISLSLPAFPCLMPQTVLGFRCSPLSRCSQASPCPIASSELWPHFSQGIPSHRICSDTGPPPSCPNGSISTAPTSPSSHHLSLSLAVSEKKLSRQQIPCPLWQASHPWDSDVEQTENTPYKDTLYTALWLPRKPFH